MGREPATRRPAPIVAPGLGDDVAVTGAFELRSHERVEDVEVHDLEAGDEPIEGLELRRVRLVHPTWMGATFTRLELQDVEIVDGELSGVTLDEGSFLRVAFVRCRLPGLVAPALKGLDVTFTDCRMDEVWLRAATLERAAFEDCSMPGSDLYSARLHECRFIRCDLRTAELSQAKLDEVAFHGSNIEGLQGGAALRNAVIGSEQILEFAGPVLHAAAIRVDDDYLAPPVE